VLLPFLCFHLMVGLGTFFIALTLFALFLIHEDRKFTVGGR